MVRKNPKWSKRTPNGQKKPQNGEKELENYQTKNPNGQKKLQNGQKKLLEAEWSKKNPNGCPPIFGPNANASKGELRKIKQIAPAAKKKRPFGRGGY